MHWIPGARKYTQLDAPYQKLPKLMHLDLEVIQPHIHTPQILPSHANNRVTFVGRMPINANFGLEFVMK
jgi:hypothetical protein